MIDLEEFDKTILVTSDGDFLKYTGTEAISFGVDLFALPSRVMWQPMFSNV